MMFIQLIRNRLNPVISMLDKRKHSNIFRVKEGATL
ncbi:hypothetical protein U14_00754 [Candidatus Moduliflexus flocculans]|uniref:Uncharacterized protein n=1 Tax=Candidatus Moduliflexus flocculans TaxID=1499966 RepID=A0A0S6VV18_9BACT|nr:hypothetical protein U14_00754 [Candidatus Moduliflexus flocculans]